MSWAAPTENGSAITGYGVRYRVKDSDSVTSGDQPGPWVTHAHTGTATTATIGSLTNDTAYQVQVRAVNSVDSSAWSVLSNGTPSSSGVAVPQGPDAPGAPTVSSRHRGLAVSWSAPAVNGSAITDYDVRYRACTATPATCESNPAWGSWTDRTGETASDTATTATIGSLTNGTAYQVQVRASSLAGDSDWSVSGDGIPAPQPPDASTAPSLTVGNQNLGVSWSAPAVNGSAITDYDVRYRACTATPATCATNPTWGGWTDRTGETASDTATTATIGSLTNSTAYPGADESRQQRRRKRLVCVRAGQSRAAAPGCARRAHGNGQTSEPRSVVDRSVHERLGGHRIRCAVPGVHRHAHNMPDEPGLGRLGFAHPRRYRHHRHDRQSDQRHRLPGAGESRKRRR